MEVSQPENANANVVNNVEITDHASQLETLQCLLILSIILSAVHLSAFGRDIDSIEYQQVIEKI